MIQAKVILDSISPNGDRLTTVEVEMHRFVLAELNTHRVFSRNSASSRAIPIEKQIKRIREDVAYPVEFGTAQPGMQADTPLEGFKEALGYKVWKMASLGACGAAYALQKLGVHKQVANRLLEPFMWHKVIISSTEWDNFLALRDHEMAQPEIASLAYQMRLALDSSTPKQLEYGEWHMPYLTEEDSMLPPEMQRKISAARCARVSYLTHDGKRSVDLDISLFLRLTEADPAHSSPLEHVATPSSEETKGNFTGWAQLRHYSPLDRLGSEYVRSLKYDGVIGMNLDSAWFALAEQNFEFAMPKEEFTASSDIVALVDKGRVIAVYERR